MLFFNNKKGSVDVPSTGRFFPKGKKGIAWPWEETGGLILTLVVFFILVIGAYFLFTVGTSKGIEEACKTSIAVKANAGVAGEVLPAACKTQQITLESGNKDQMMRQIADLMANCDDQFLRGTYTKVLGGTFSAAGKNRCFVCYQITMPKGSEEIKGFDDLYFYLNNNKKFGTDMTYYQFISNEGRVFPAIESDIRAEQHYAIAFASQAETSGWTGTAVTGGILGLAIITAPLTVGGSVAAAIPITLYAAGAGLGAVGTALTVADTSKLFQERKSSVLFLTHQNLMGGNCDIQ